MKTLLKLSAASAILLLTACGDKTETTVSDAKPSPSEVEVTAKDDTTVTKTTIKTPKNEAEALDVFKTAEENYLTAKNNLSVFRTCPEENVLADISSYSTELGNPELSQEKWLKSNGKRKDVKTTASGLQYSVNKASTMTDTKPPMPTQKVRVNYHGLFLNGETFDSSYDRGEDIEFPLNGVIKGWTEGVGLMRPCDAWTFYIPSDLAYGPNGRGSIPPATPLVFHVQLLEISDN